MKEALNKLRKKIMKNKSVRNGALFSIFSFINKGFAFILLIIIANLMSPAEYGYLNLFNTVVMVIGYFIALSAEGYLSVAYFRDGEIGIAKTFSSVLIITTIISSICAIIIWIGGSWLSNSLSLPFHILFLSIAICCFTVYNNMFLDALRIKEKVVKYGILSCSCALCNFAISILLIKYLDFGWEGRAYAQTVCFAIFGWIGLVYFFKNRYWSCDIKSFFKPLLIWSLPLIPHAATNFIRQGCDRYIINYFHSIDEVGLFSFALTLVNVITMIGFGFNQSNSVDIYKTLSSKEIRNEEKKQKLSKQRHLIMWVYVATTIVATISMFFIVPLIMPKYEDAMGYFAILAIYGFGVCIYLLYTNYLFFYKCTRQIMYVTFGTALLHLILSMIFTRSSLYYTALLYGVTQILTVILIRKVALNKLNKELK